jgi:hypothetical protein
MLKEAKVISKKTLGALALALTFSIPAFAQDNAEPFPVPPPEKKAPDPGNWRPSDTSKAPVLAPAPGGKLSPTAPGTGAALGAAPKKELTEEEQARRDRAIQKNYDEAEKILRGTLDDKESAYKSTSTRVSRLKDLIKSYEQKRIFALNRKRSLQVEIFNRSLYLQKQKENGTIPTAIYNKKLTEENDRFVRERKTLDADLKFLGEEIIRLRKELKGQEAEKRVQEVTNPALLRKRNKKKSKEPSLPSYIDKKIRSLSAFKIKGSLGNERLNGHP